MATPLDPKQTPSFEELIKVKEDMFTDELEVFRTEVESAIQFFYAYLTINAALEDNKKALDLVNKTPLFWRTNIGALQTAFFITLGRIFDQKSQHNVDKLLGIAQKQSVIFSAKALEARKRDGSANAEQWIYGYMKDVYLPTAHDFRRLRGYVKKYRRIYENGYRDIRKKIYAHKELSKLEDVQRLYAKTNIREMQKLFIFLNRLCQALWQLFNNGRKPTLKPMKYSVASMRKAEIPKWQSRHVQQEIVDETKSFFEILSTAPNEWLKK